MSGDGGFTGWEPPFGHEFLPAEGSIYFAGHWFRDWPEGEGGTNLTWRPDDGVILIPMLGGNSVVQVPYRGSRAPLIGDKQVFTGGFLCDREEDFIRFEMAQSEGEAVYFCPGLWRLESFPAASGSTYTLSRPLAVGIVPNVTAELFPPRFYVDGVEDEDAATVAGQTVTAAATGKLSVWYLPVFKVVVLDYERVIAGPNELVVTFTLSEVVDGDFG